MSVSSVSLVSFKASVYVSDKLNREVVNMCQDFGSRCVCVLASHYNFDASEAERLLGLSMIRVEGKAAVKKDKAVAKVSVPKPSFPLPYNGELNESFCYALRQNNGLYTQCTGLRKGEAEFCKSCANSMQKTGAEVPEYGTIQQRMAVDIFEYIDPKGRKPISYTKVMKKYKISKEQVLEEAGKFNIIVNSNHFVAPEETKRGRPKTEKEPKAKGVKGRPKKEKKVLTVEGEEEDDLFAALVANSLEDIDSHEVEQAKLEEKEAKNEGAEAAKKEKEEKLAIEKQAKKEAAEAAKKEKEAKKEAERLAREEKKQAEEQAKLAKKEAAEKAKAEKLAAKEQKKPSESVPNVEDKEPDEEPDVVKKIVFEGNKYLKSKKSGIIYDYNEYVKNGDQVVVGKWNDTTNTIDFTPSTKDEEEEEEEEYEQ